MTEGRDSQAWNNDDRGGYSDSYTGLQGQDNLNANDNSLETSASTWVIIFDHTGYTGNCKKIPPGRYIRSLSETHRHDNSGKEAGDWKNHIQSFILYKQKPAFWDTGNDLKSKLARVSMNNSQQGRRYIADITKANMNAINECMSYS